jgi:protease I
MAVVLMPLPARDFDPTESGVPWKLLHERGHRVVFATPDGKPAQADPRMLDGKGLGPLKPFLVADRNGRDAYRAMAASASFRAPLRYGQIAASAFDGLLLPGGHAPGMCEYLESHILHGVVSWMFLARRSVGAICHGVVLVARSLGMDGLSVLHGRQTTALLQSQELLAWNLTRAWLGDYYRTYPQTVQAEVTEALAERSDFVTGPLPLRRDTPDNLKPGFAQRDGNYLSARWPGDAHRFARDFCAMLAQQ